MRCGKRESLTPWGAKLFCGSTSTTQIARVAALPRHAVGDKTHVMFDAPPKPQRNPSFSRTLLRVLLISAGSVAILLPAWLPNRPSAPLERGTVELLQAFLLAASAVLMFGASPHAGAYRPVCRVLGLGLMAAFSGEIEDFVSGMLHLRFPEAWIAGAFALAAIITALRHRRVVVHFIATLGQHAGAGLIAAALLIIYVFNRVMGSSAFWKASLGEAYSPNIARICKGYLELLACYLIFIGALGLSLTLARRRQP